MPDEYKAKERLEIAHVLFMDIVGYSKLLTDEQSEALHELNLIVRNTEAVHEAEAQRALTGRCEKSRNKEQVSRSYKSRSKRSLPPCKR
jgi:hypothetical protein